MENVINKKVLTPVYMSVPQLERLMDLVATRSLDSVSLAVFKNYQFNESDASLAVGTLKFLGLVDENNSATEAMSKMRLKGDMKKQEFEKILRVAYSALFKGVEAPQELSQDDLTNEFYVRYSQSIKSDRVARSAVSAFLKLCEYAGLREEGSVTVKKHAPKNARSVPRKRTAGKENSVGSRDAARRSETSKHGMFTFPIVEGEMTIEIPEAWHLQTVLDDNLNTSWRDVIKAAHKFASEYQIANPSEKTIEGQDEEVEE